MRQMAKRAALDFASRIRGLLPRRGIFLQSETGDKAARAMFGETLEEHMPEPEDFVIVVVEEPLDRWHSHPINWQDDDP